MSNAETSTPKCRRLPTRRPGRRYRQANGCDGRTYGAVKRQIIMWSRPGSRSGCSRLKTLIAARSCWTPAPGLAALPTRPKLPAILSWLLTLLIVAIPDVWFRISSTANRPTVVGNPPFKAVEPFAHHALKLGARRVALLFPTARLNGARWLRKLPLRRIWLLTPRPSMPPGSHCTG